MSPALSRALDPLRFRPLFWMALAALLGVAAGGQWAGLIDPLSRSDTGLALPVFPALFCGGAIWFFRAHGLFRRLALAGCLFFVFAFFAARRITPPAGDISDSVRLKAVPEGTITALPLKLSGVVADYPRIGDFNVQFPLNCDAPLRGQVWITAPYSEKFEVGDRVELSMQLRPLPHPGNWGERDSSWRYIGASCWCLGRRVQVNRRLGVAPGYGLPRLIGTWRAALLHFYEAQFRGAATTQALRARPYPAATAQLLTAMVFGEGGLYRPLPPLLQDDFRAAGLSHILVSSGSQVAFLAGIVLFLGQRLGFKRSPFLLVIVPILVFYGLLAGGAASIWRATLGGALLCCAGLLGRDFDGLSIWGAAILFLLWLDPAVAWSLSFQLTFAATWGMLVLTPALIKGLEMRFEKSQLGKGICVSLGAQWATIPLSLFHFGTFSAAGIAANFLAVPLAGFMIASGLCGLIFHGANFVNYYLTRGVTILAHSSAALSGAYYEGTPVALSTTWLLYAILLFGIIPFSFDPTELRQILSSRWDALKSQLPQLGPISIGSVFLIVSLWLWLARSGSLDSRLRVTMIDVGQGESILIRCPSGQNILVDGGSLETQPRSDIGAQVIVPTLQSLGVEKIDLMVLTHSDADHCNGLAAVAREIPVDAFLDGPGAIHSTPDPAVVDYFQLRQALETKKVPVIIPTPGQNYQFGEARLQVLAPTLPAFNSENDNCIVSRLDFGQTSILLTGDIEQIAEDRLVQRGANLKCTVLKVPHHGSKGSSSEAFLNSANPSIALISCGRYNAFGHPGAQTLHRLTDRKAAIFRTDVNGAIEVDCDGQTCGVETFK